MFFRGGLAFLAVGFGATALAALSGCGSPDAGIHMEGSDTMSNVAQAWAEQYHARNPEVMVQVRGGGSGLGIASLIQGNCDLANASRDIEEKEIQQLWDKRHLKPKEFIVGYDALAVYVHEDNPLNSISLDELAEIFGEGGRITKWSQLGVRSEAIRNDAIVRVCRQNSSGTYAYFRDVVLGKHGEYKLGSLDQCGSADVVALIAHTPGAIGYSGMGFAGPGVKMLKISKHKGGPALAPTLENATKKKDRYPITRSLLIYTAGELKGEVPTFLDWILGKEGQEVVRQLGFVPKSDHD